jgi:hypothetical protein
MAVSTLIDQTKNRRAAACLGDGIGEATSSKSTGLSDGILLRLLEDERFASSQAALLGWKAERS